MSLLSRDFDETAQARTESLSEALWRQAGLWAQILALIALSVFPLGFLHMGSARPAFLPAAVYYWAVHAPHRLSPLSAFLAGLVLDLLSGGPAGLSAFLFLVLQRAVLRQRKTLAGQPFVVVWMGFALAAAGLALAQWAAASLFAWTLLPPRDGLVGAGLTALSYPAVAWLLGLFVRGGRRD